MNMPKVKHIALLKFKDGTAPEQVDQVFEKLLELSESIDGIEDYVSGSNNSPEGLSQGYTHGFVMTFRDAAARDSYLTHSDHERVKTEVLPSVESVVIFDFEV
jgi:stress responsive alpha/beta barrel protein